MISYYMTRIGKIYLCSICKNLSPSIVSVRVDNEWVQFCEKCWQPEYKELGEDSKNEEIPIN